MDDKTYQLKFLPLFYEDLNEIVDYIALKLKNPAAANKLIDDVESAINDRLTCAESFEPYKSLNEHPYPYYRIQVKNFTVFYVDIGDTMEVRRLIYSRRNLSRQI